MNVRNWIKFIALGIIWGTSFLWIRIAVKDIGPYLLVFFRILFAFLGIVAYLLIARIKITFSWRKLGIFAFLGIFNVTVPFILISWAEQFISSGLASVMNSVYPLFTLVLSAIFLPDEGISWLRTIGLLMGFGGVVVLASAGFGKGDSNGIIPGIIAMLVATVGYAVSMVFARKMTVGLEPGEQAAGQTLCALVGVSIAAVLFEPNLRLPAAGITWIAVLWLGLLGTAVAIILWFSLLNEVGATRTSLVGYVYPVIAVVLGIIFLDEKFSWRLLIGGLMVVGGVVWVNYLKSSSRPVLIETKN